MTIAPETTMLASRRRTKGESSFRPCHFRRKNKRRDDLSHLVFLAGAEGLEPTTHGFGDQYSTN